MYQHDAKPEYGLSRMAMVEVAKSGRTTILYELHCVSIIYNKYGLYLSLSSILCGIEMVRHCRLLISLLDMRPAGLIIT